MMTVAPSFQMVFSEEEIFAHIDRGNRPAGELDALAVRNAARLALRDDVGYGFAAAWVAVSAATNLESHQVEKAAMIYATLTQLAADHLATVGEGEEVELNALRGALCRFLDGHGVLISDVMEQ